MGDALKTLTQQRGAQSGFGSLPAVIILTVYGRLHICHSNN